jgi:hypothetical protein
MVDYGRMRRSKVGLIAVALLVATSAVSGAQGRNSGSSNGRTGGSGDTVPPPAAMPPAGMCRIWISGVPADKQGAIIDCATAVRNVPPNGRVIWGETSKGKPATPPPGTKVPPPGKTNPIKTVPPPRIPPPGRDTANLGG